MKTIIDVVNELKGDLDSCEYTAKYWQDLGFKYLCESDRYTQGKFVFALTKNHGENTICSIYAFNELVTELSNWQPTLPKAETVEVDGFTYEIGKAYQTNEHIKVTLINVEDGKFFVGRLGAGDFWGGWLEREIFETTVDLGTITPAPTKLIDNNIYTFELNCDLWSGFYRESRGSFFTQLVGGNKICSTSEAGQITHLTAAK